MGNASARGERNTFSTSPKSARGLKRGVEPDRILVVGLPGSGKTSILYKIKLGEVVETSPTVGMYRCLGNALIVQRLHHRASQEEKP